MTQIIAMSGEKQSGKDTACNYITMLKLVENGVSAHAIINSFGKIEVSDIFGEKIGNGGTFPIDHSSVNKELLFNDQVSFCKTYSFADILKKFMIDAFGIDKDDVYGHDVGKNKKTKYKWSDMPGVITTKSLHKDLPPEVKRKVYFHQEGYMTIRDFMQWFGTDICRYIYADIWVDAVIKKIQTDAPKIALISDCRFDNEITKIQSYNGYVIGFTRKIDYANIKKKHASEQINLELCDTIIDNQDLDIPQTCQKLYDRVKQFSNIIPPLNNATRCFV